MIPRVLIHCGLVALLCACTPHADIRPREVPEDTGSTVNVLVGTTRAKTPDGLYHPSKRDRISFAEVAVSVPPRHEVGRVEIGDDPSRHFMTRRLQPLSDQGYRAAITRKLRQNPDWNGEVFIFIHGYNNTLADGVFRTAQMKQDLPIDALPVHYAWPSSGTAIGYPHDRDSVLYARRGLQDLIEETAAAGAQSIILLAHSLGSQVTLETLRQMSLSGRGAAWDRINGVALMAPDMDVDVFNAVIDDIGELPQPFLVFTSSRDRALRVSAQVTGHDRRVGNLETVEPIAQHDIVVLDVSEFRDTRNVHMTVVSSPTLIKLSENRQKMADAFQSGASAQAGLIPGTIIAVQNATAVLLDPAQIQHTGQ
ncbi:esterase/lipase superfamily enzyme [Aliiruegeria haliotis]|uniref:Esterase/lipase superfamily enzyme n=1 Tax=Aliiruegeria haliotis TaxID=1280846 RepID=A0A2T0RHX8_9RHOB|nr:alpha/beta hydrolase [Aliiruegeria haliotis]PRY20700.1 esterase/lipase superfamily enzyme [Aliiruegeria haliotis]